MTLETMPRPNSDVGHEAKKKLLIIGPGANANNLRKAPGGLSESDHHDIYYAGVSTAEPAFEIEEGHLYEIDTEEGQDRMQRLLADKAFHATYDSTPEWLHKNNIVRGVGEIAEGHGNLYVVTKPVVENLEQARDVRAALIAADRRMQERLGDAYDPEQKPSFLLVHEHYLTKGAWHAIRMQLNDVCDLLGRLESAEVHIQEHRTAKEEGRAEVVGSGAFKDMGPHTLSLGLDVQEVINANPRGQFLITDKTKTDVDFIRHDDSGLPIGIETGFRIRGVTQVIDKTNADTHDLTFVWTGGKGLIDKKEVRLTFVHPDSGKRNTIVVDLIANKLDIPNEVSHLFPTTQFEDNGYGASVAAGLNGGNPRDHFQSYWAAEKVVLWGGKLTEKGRAKGEPIPYSGKKTIEKIFKPVSKSVKSNA